MTQENTKQAERLEAIFTEWLRRGDEPHIENQSFEFDIPKQWAAYFLEIERDLIDQKVIE